MIQLAAVAGPVAKDVIGGFALSLAPEWLFPGAYFGVRVAPDYRGTEEARRSRRSFVSKVWLATGAAAAVSLAAAGRPWPALLGFAIQAGVAIAAYRAGWRETIPHRAAPSSERTAYLLAPPPRVPGGAAAVIAPFLVLAGAAVYLLAKWSSIPARFPVHWDLSGHANGWSERSVGGVFGAAIIGFGVLALLAGTIALLQRVARRAPAGTGRYRRNRAMLAIPVIAMWVDALTVSLVSLIPVIAGNGRLPGAAFALLIAVPAAGAIAAVVLVARGSTEADAVPGTPDEGWRCWGQCYYNPADSSVFVEKRFGLGYTLNFARWESWVVLGGALLLPLLIVLLVHPK